MIREQSSLFDVSPAADVVAASRSDILRTIEHKAGLFKEVREGKETGRQFRVLDLVDGRRVIEFTTGERVPAPAGISDVYIDDGLRFGTLVERTL